MNSFLNEILNESSLTEAQKVFKDKNLLAESVYDEQTLVPYLLKLLSYIENNEDELRTMTRDVNYEKLKNSIYSVMDIIDPDSDIEAHCSDVAGNTFIEP